MTYGFVTTATPISTTSSTLGKDEKMTPEMTPEMTLKIIRRIKDYLHKYATVEQIKHIANYLGINTEVKN